MIVKNPQSVEDKDELGFTPLAWAAEAGQKEAANLLLSLGANPDATNSSGRYPIDWAATSGHLPLVELLVDKTSNDKSVTLFLAVQQQQVSAVKKNKKPSPASRPFRLRSRLRFNFDAASA